MVLWDLKTDQLKHYAFRVNWWKLSQDTIDSAKRSSVHKHLCDVFQQSYSSKILHLSVCLKKEIVDNKNCSVICQLRNTEKVIASLISFWEKLDLF